MPAKIILFPTDYSETSSYALQIATALARSWNAKMLIAHMSEHELYPVGEQFDEEPEPPPGEVAELEKIVPTAESVPCEHRLLFAPPRAQNVKPAEEIVKLADQENVDAIVLGTHGRSGLKHLLMGSVSEDVLRHANCPVIMIKPPSSEQ